MPAEIQVNDRTLELTPEFAYRHIRGNPIQFQAVGEAVEDAGTLKFGDVLNRSTAVKVSCAGSGTLLQIGHDEIAKLGLPWGAATRASELHEGEAVEDNVSDEPTPAKPDKDEDGEDGGTDARVKGDTEPKSKSK